MALVLGVGGMTWAYLVDDAFILTRYAETLAAGGGWAVNAGHPTDGVTAPLWLLPLAGAARLGLDVVDIQRALGLGAMAWATALASRGAATKGSAWVGALVLTVQPALGLWGSAGLETGVATLALVVLARPAWGSGRDGMATLAAVSLPWLRPELLAAGGCLALARALGGPVSEPSGAPARSTHLGPLGGLLAGLASVVAFRWLAFGHPLPLAASAKMGSLPEGLSYTLVGAGLVSGATGAFLAARGARRLPSVGVALVAHGLAVAVAGGDWMPGHRLLVPAIPLFAVLVAAGFPGTPRWRWPALVPALLVPLAAAAVALPAAADAGRLRRSSGPRVAAAIRGRGPVALVDIGYLGWATGVEVVDLAGITDPTIARAPGGHLAKEIPVGYLDARAPSAILLHAAVAPTVDGEGRLETLAGYPVERSLARSGWVRTHFRVGAVVEYRPGYFYVRLDRRSLTGGEGSPSSGRPRPAAAD